MPQKMAGLRAFSLAAFVTMALAVIPLKAAAAQALSDALGKPTLATSFALIWTGNEWQRRSGGSWREVGFEQTDDHPVVNVSWNDAVAFAGWLSRKEGRRYRLPTSDFGLAAVLKRAF